MFSPVRLAKAKGCSGDKAMEQQEPQALLVHWCGDTDPTERSGTHELQLLILIELSTDLKLTLPWDSLASEQRMSLIIVKADLMGFGITRNQSHECVSVRDFLDWVWVEVGRPTLNA